MLSRRTVLSSLAASPALGSTVLAKVQDGELNVLSRQFDILTAQLDHAIEHGLDIEQDVLDEFSRIEGEIVATSATSIEGLRVKARAACWALLGDLDSGDQSTTDKQMALSIVRDLIHLYDSGLEQPGASKKLVEDIERGADNSVTRESTD
jgi:hypothetical protein